ncbi:MAG: hypothetical protein WD646_06670 [Actinomycetota bacterium]
MTAGLAVGEGVGGGFTVGVGVGRRVGVGVARVVVGAAVDACGLADAGARETVAVGLAVAVAVGLARGLGDLRAVGDGAVVGIATWSSPARLSISSTAMAPKATAKTRAIGSRKRSIGAP